MTWNVHQILGVIAIIFAIVSGGVVVMGPAESNTRLSPGLMVLSVILLGVAMVVP